MLDPSVYPYIMPYPIRIAASSNFISDSEADLPNLHALQKSLSVSAAVAYPVFNIYPAMYPDFDIYPSLVDFGSPFGPKDDRNSVRAHPEFDIYPAIMGLQKQDGLHCEKSLSVHLDILYPAFNLYPTVYPTIELYPAIHTPDEVVRDIQSNWALSSEQVSGGSLSVRLDCSYPILCIYPAVYPFFELYPTLSASLEHQQVEICPAFDLSPPVYPQFLYNSDLRQNEDRSSSLSTRLPARYPAFDLYPALYPYFDLYPRRHIPTTLLSPLVNGMGVPTLSKVPKIEDEIRLKADRSQSLPGNPVVGASEPTGVRRSRTRSGTVTGRRIEAPTIGTVEHPSLPATSPSTMAPSPRTATSGPPPQTDGLPSNPAVTRWSLPLQHVSVPMPKTVASSSGESVDVIKGHVHPSLSPVDEHPTPKITGVMRTHSMALPPKPVNAGIDRSRSLLSRPRGPRKRDSLVLTRAKAFEASSAHQN